MSHIVFVMGANYPDFDANTNCVNNVIEKIIADGHKVSCVCAGESEAVVSYHGTMIYKVKHIAYEARYAKAKPMQQKVMKLCHFLHSALVLPIFPNVEPMYSIKLYRQLEKVHKKTPIDCVVGVFRPFSCVWAAVKFGKKRNVKMVGYYLDILKGAVKPSGISQQRYEAICDKGELRIFPQMDLLLMAENGRTIYQQDKRFSQYTHIRYVNFPTLVLRKSTHKYIDGNRQAATMVYAGYMDVTYRNPVPVIESVIQAKQENPHLQLHLYGSSNMEQEIYRFVSENPDTIFYHGKVDKTVADRALAEADYLINIGNDILGVVPSKVFELIGLKKPIVYFTNKALDSALPYFEQYPDVCIIEKKEDCVTSAQKMVDFIQSERKDIEDAFLRKHYDSALPDTTAQYIEGVAEIAK